MGSKVTDLHTRLPIDPRVRDSEHRAMLVSSRYQCGRCGSTAFAMLADGGVECWECQQAMFNIRTEHT